MARHALAAPSGRLDPAGAVARQLDDEAALVGTVMEATAVTLTVGTVTTGPHA
jgi:hypothetical protein